jgi:hypothetical protein
MAIGEPFFTALQAFLWSSPGLSFEGDEQLAQPQSYVLTHNCQKFNPT